MSVSDETDDIDVSFIKQDKLNFVWSQREDRCWVSKENVICRISTLLAHGHGARSYCIIPQMNWKEHKINLVICRQQMNRIVIF